MIAKMIRVGVIGIAARTIPVRLQGIELSQISVSIPSNPDDLDKLDAVFVVLGSSLSSKISSVASMDSAYFISLLRLLAVAGERNIERIVVEDVETITPNSGLIERYADCYVELSECCTNEISPHDCSYLGSILLESLRDCVVLKQSEALGRFIYGQ